MDAVRIASALLLAATAVGERNDAMHLMQYTAESNLAAEDDRCRPWCINDSKKGWEEKCGYRACKGCEDCKQQKESIRKHGSGKQPHILLIVVDDFGSADPGYKGSEIVTPNLDRLAQEGRVLTNYYIQPTCTPSRAALHTGRYPMRMGTNFADTGVSAVGVPLSETFFPEVMKRLGYATHAVGKWHLGRHRWENTPAFRGYDTYYGFLNGAEDFFDHRFPHGDLFYDLLWQESPRCGEDCAKVPDELGRYSTHVFTEQAVRRIEEHEGDEPLFINVMYNAVHTPTQAPLQFVEPYLNKSSDYVRAVYAGMVAAFDEGLGNLTAALVKKGIMDDSIIVVTSDSGGPIDACFAQGSSNGKLRAGKCALYEGGTKVTGIVRIGSNFAPQSVEGKPYTHLMHGVDLLPTLADAGGADLGKQITNKPLDGISQWTSLITEGGEPVRTEVFLGLLTDAPRSKNGAAVRSGKWKLITGLAKIPAGQFNHNNVSVHPTDSSGRMISDVDHRGEVVVHLASQDAYVAMGPLPSGEEEDDFSLPFPAVHELYNVEDDEEEQHDLSKEHPDIVKQLQARIDYYADQAALDPNPSVDHGCRGPPKHMPLYGPGGLEANWPWCPKCDWCEN